MTEQPLRVAYILTSGGGTGGMESHLLSLLCHMSRQEVAPLVVLPEAARHGALSQTLGELSVPVHFHAMVRDKWDVCTLAGLTGLLRRCAPSVVHVHLPSACDNLYPFIAARLAMCAVVVSTEHSASTPALFRSRRARLFKHAVVALQDCVITVCDYIRDQLVEHARLPLRKMVTIHNGVEVPAAADADGRCSREIRLELGLDVQAPLVGMVARLDPWYKRFDDFLRAARHISGEFPAAQFVIVGDGDHRYRAALEELGRQLELSNRLRFLGFRGDASRIIGALDTLVLASDHEGFPLVTLEAMARGTPVVATALGGLREQIQHGETGYLVPARSASGLAEGVLSVLRNPPRSREMTRRARRVVETRFDARGMAQKTASLYLQVLQRRLARREKKGLLAGAS